MYAPWEEHMEVLDKAVFMQKVMRENTRVAYDVFEEVGEKRARTE